MKKANGLQAFRRHAEVIGFRLRLCGSEHLPLGHNFQGLAFYRFWFNQRRDALIQRGKHTAPMNPQKDAERAAQLAPYAQVVAGFAAKPSNIPEARAMQEEFRWLVEEFKVSLFAQELGTAVPISAKRLDQKLEQLRLL